MPAVEAEVIKMIKDHVRTVMNDFKSTRHEFLQTFLDSPTNAIHGYSAHAVGTEAACEVWEEICESIDNDVPLAKSLAARIGKVTVWINNIHADELKMQANNEIFRLIEQERLRAMQHELEILRNYAAILSQAGDQSCPTT